MIDEAKIWDLINASEVRMSFAQRRMWELVRIDPQPWHVEGRGPSWLVAVVGIYALVYNDIEEGFSRSQMTSPGKLSGVDGLGWKLEELMQ